MAKRHSKLGAVVICGIIAVFLFPWALVQGLIHDFPNPIDYILGAQDAIRQYYQKITH